MARLTFVLVCLALSLSNIALADIIIEKEASMPVEAVTSASAMPVLQRLAQRIHAEQLPADKSLLAASARATPAIYQEFSHSLFNQPWKGAYEQCSDATLRALKDLLDEFWNRNGNAGNQGFIHIFDYMGDRVKKSLVRLNELSNAFKTGVRGSYPKGSPNANLKAIGELLEELMIPFNSYKAPKYFDQEVLKAAILRDPAFVYPAQLTKLAAASTAIQTLWPAGHAAPPRNAIMEAARAQLATDIAALNTAIQHNLAVAGPLHFCVSFLGIATAVTAGLSEAHHEITNNLGSFYCSYDKISTPIPHSANVNVEEIFWLPIADRGYFQYTKAEAGVEIRRYNDRFSTFIPLSYFSSQVDDAAKSHPTEAAAQKVDEQNIYYKEAMKQFGIKYPPDAKKPVLKHPEDIAKRFKDALNDAGLGKVELANAVAKRKGLQVGDSAVLKAMKAATTAKLYQCLL